ncbi:hypothetical protein ABZ319_04510 [Nocardia sp. NPDC005978]|uniref:Rv0361 family membrane protein n=1 Tax=Nocardia sp. NPDC005978 TaxID=3156725 RepID=UPI0033B392FB
MAAVAIVTAIGIGIGLLVLRNGSGGTDEDRIRAVVDSFSDAVYSADTAAMADNLCAEEAETFTDGLAPDAAVEREKGAIPKPSYTLSEVTIHGEYASAKIRFDSAGTQDLYFRMESGRWRVCAPAEAQMPN